ncbi:MBL fold metallo-hydrolase [Eubacteriales bacterium OttesenSCG-928-N13]|nr:MBL fold metallo-hydrolase [Eubacteriales bacterium OttesenSCG-928-N13]
MKLKVFGTGSKGNAYAWIVGRDVLLLDAGLPWKTIIEGLDDGLRGVCGCLVTHEHKDHSKAVPDMLKYGIKTVMSDGTAKAISPPTPDTSVKPVQARIRAVNGEPIHLLNFAIVPFTTQHDAAQPLGYLVKHKPTGATLVYATDTYYLKYTFPGVNYWLIECNYTMKLANKLLEDESGKSLYDRLMKSHMSLDRLLEVFRVNDLSQTRTIVLIHMSDERSNEAEMVEAVYRQTSIRTIAAKNGQEIDFEYCPF